MVVLLVGGLLSFHFLPAVAFWFIPLLFLVLRPLAVWLGLVSARASRLQQPLMAWFGIRGIGSLYYLAYAIRHGLPPATAQLLTTLTVSTIAVSIVVHGVSVTPLMKVYGKRAQAAKVERIHIRTSQAMRCVSSPLFSRRKICLEILTA